MDWIRLAQNRDRLWAVVNTVMNLRAPENERNVFFLLKTLKCTDSWVIPR